jgi:hypothetical protein
VGDDETETNTKEECAENVTQGQYAAGL